MQKEDIKGEVLVTDSLFIYQENIEKLKAHGLKVVRLNKEAASTEELVAALKGKLGYILGGVEKVTKEVLDGAKDLKAIAVPGIGYQFFVPAHGYAKEKGVLISNAPEAPTSSTAEWCVMAALAMNRGLFSIGRTGKLNFEVTRGLEDQRIGIVGMGRVGQSVVDKIVPFRTGEVLFYNRSKKTVKGCRQASIEDVFKNSDIIFVTVGDLAGPDFINSSHIGLMPRDSLIVNIAKPFIINNEDIFRYLKAGKIRMVSDYDLKGEFNNLPYTTWYCNNGTNGSITVSETKRASDMATESIINLLEKGEDKNRVV